MNVISFSVILFINIEIDSEFSELFDSKKSKNISYANFEQNYKNSFLKEGLVSEKIKSIDYQFYS